MAPKCILLLLAVTVLGCHKKNTWKDHCVLLKYLGNGCYPVVQVITHIEHNLDGWSKGDTVYAHCAVLFDIPEQYKDGQLFSATLLNISYDNNVRNAMCSAPRELLDVNNYSSMSCVLPE